MYVWMYVQCVLHGAPLCGVVTLLFFQGCRDKYNSFLKVTYHLPTKMIGHQFSFNVHHVHVEGNIFLLSTAMLYTSKASRFTLQCLKHIVANL